MSINEVRWLSECGSTNAYAKEHFEEFGPVGAVYTTNQTAGRGRLGRSSVNPRCYPGLKRWIAEFGDDRARETLAQYGFTAEAFGGPVQDQEAPAQAALQAAEQAQQPAAQAAFEEPVATNPYGFTAEQALTTTDQMQIAQIAQYAPELRACIARNPNTYPALIEWLGQLGDPAINAALASRQ